METRSPSEIGKRHRREVDVAIGKSIILVEGAEEGGKLNEKLLWHVKSTLYWVEFQVYRNCDVGGQLQNSTKQ